ncbi:uncharacterized protein LOC122544255 [Chiloscyllium plagiosum]|uniref:uncharacterized protein LOC122544255 n=1 Tax=Chiloscyllium plagiosum TaxID=36176 RepID=UPI001CB80F74|nr:uncharacterized protein LOC122544255 [Chiloscyllium plagiosum]
MVPFLFIGHGIGLTMSHHHTANRSNILKYFESALRGSPREKGRPPSAVTNTRPAPGQTCNAAVKVKRRKTRRELNRAKFGRDLDEKPPRRKPWAQRAGKASGCHCQRVRAEPGAAAKPSACSSWVITQNRLTQRHLGIFNKEVKSVAAERLPLSDGQGDAGEPAPQTAKDASLGGTPLPGKEVTPLPAPVEEPRSPTPEPARKGCQPTVTHRPPAPVDEVAQKLLRALGTQRAFPGQTLVRQTQQQLLELLVKRHGRWATRLLEGNTSATNAPEIPWPHSGTDPPKGHVIASNTSPSGDQLTQKTSLVRKERDCEFPVHSTPLMMNHVWYRQQQSDGFSVCVHAATATASPAPCLQQEVTDGATLITASQASHHLLRPRSQVQERPTSQHCARPQQMCFWANAGPLQTARVGGAIFPSPVLSPSRSESAWDLLTRAVSGMERNCGLSPLPPAASTPEGQLFTLGKDSGFRARCWEARDGPGRSHFPKRLQGPTTGDPEGHRIRGLPLGDIGNLYRPQVLEGATESATGTRGRQSICGSAGLDPWLWPAQAQAGALPLPLAFYYPPSGALEWADSPVPGWGRASQTPTWKPTSPEPWVYPRMKLY